MKYIKLYENFDGDDMKFINHRMISDLKDLCMDGFDKNYSLLIQFFIGNNPKPISYAFINHDIEEYKWYKSLYKMKWDYTGKTKYRWRFMGDEDRNIYDMDNGLISEIDDRIRAMYPNEDVKYWLYV